MEMRLKPKTAETARQERAQGGLPDATTSGDSAVNAAAGGKQQTGTQPKTVRDGTAKHEG
jgi:hypothetical protein